MLTLLVVAKKSTYSGVLTISGPLSTELVVSSEVVALVIVKPLVRVSLIDPELGKNEHDTGPVVISNSDKNLIMFMEVPH
jgi:hypothetical protein